MRVLELFSTMGFLFCLAVFTPTTYFSFLLFLLVGLAITISFTP